MIVRPAKGEDVAAIEDIITRCDLRVEGVNYTDWSGLLLVAVRQAQVVGFIAALPGKPYAVITEMGVLPEHQRGRACHQLLSSMELLFRSLGVTAWAAYTGDKREAGALMSKWGAPCTGTGTMHMRVL